MIQANELRIGNYVSTEIHGIGFVEAISGNDILYSRNYDSIPLQQFNSIPLTEELKKSINTLNEFILIDKTGFIIFKNGYRYQFIFDDYPYLHQLQNLFWCLTEKELEINL